MHRYASAGVVLALIWSSGCTPPRQNSAAPSVSVKGTVTVNGKPMPNGEIWFSVPGNPPSVIAVQDGTFSGLAHAGKNHVEVYTYKEGPPSSTDPKGPPTRINTIAPKFNGQASTLNAEVTAGAANEFKFDITSK